jgi:hypothetical protein
MAYEAWPVRNRYRKQNAAHLLRVDAGDYPAYHLYTIYFVAMYCRLNIQDWPGLCTDKHMQRTLQGCAISKAAILD